MLIFSPTTKLLSHSKLRNKTVCISRPKNIVETESSQVVLENTHFKYI